MKRLVFAIFALFVAACGSNGGSGNTVVAVTPSDLRCINGSTTCNNGAYANYAGWTTYSMPYGNSNYNLTGYFNQYGFCGCPTGYTAAYNGSMGLGCVNTQIFNQFYGSAVFMAFGGGGVTGWGGGGAVINIPQVSNIPNSAYQGNCSRQVAQSCLLDQGNSCGAGATCRQVLSGSNLGVCVNPYQTYPAYGSYPGNGGYNTYNSNGFANGYIYYGY